MNKKIEKVINQNEAVKYKNEVNKMYFGDLSEIDLNCLFAIFAKMKDRKDEVVTIPLKELKKLIEYKGTDSKQFRLILGRIYEKFLKMILTVKDKGSRDGIRKFQLFSRLFIPDNEDIIEISIHQDFIPYLNELSDNFTRFDLSKFVNIKSKYSKIIYRLLCQYKNTGALFISWEDFIKTLNVPNSYKASDVDKRILKPAVTELPFDNLKYRKHKEAGKGRGGKIVGIEFTFLPIESPLVKKYSENQLLLEYDNLQIKKELGQYAGTHLDIKFDLFYRGMFKIHDFEITKDEKIEMILFDCESNKIRRKPLIFETKKHVENFISKYKF